MTTKSVADRLVALCREGQFEKAQTELYAADAKSIEMESMKDGPMGNAQGLDAIREKGRQFQSNVEQMHAIQVSDPLVAEPFFTCTMRIEATWKHNGQRSSMEEICLYQVKDDKIVTEQFFYGPMQ
jgi:hypothetical protein